MGRLEEVIAEYGINLYIKKPDWPIVEKVENPIALVNWNKAAVYRHTQKRKKEIETSIMEDIFIENVHMKIEDPHKFAKKFNLDDFAEALPKDLFEKIKFHYTEYPKSFFVSGETEEITLEEIFETGENWNVLFSSMEKDYRGIFKENIDYLDPEYKLKRVFAPEQAEKDLIAKINEKVKKVIEQIRTINGERFSEEISIAVIQEDIETKTKLLNELQIRMMEEI